MFASSPPPTSIYRKPSDKEHSAKISISGSTSSSSICPSCAHVKTISSPSPITSSKCENAGAPNVDAFSIEAREALLAHDWPGNVRELENRIQRAVLVAQSAEISARDLGLAAAAPPPAMASREASDERETLERVLRETGGVIARAAATLGVSRQALYRRMQRAGVSFDRRTKGGTPTR